MKRVLAIAILLMGVGSICAVAANWTELEWAASVVTDSKTGDRAIRFSTGLAYDELPKTTDLSISWEVYRIEGNSEIVLYEFSRTATAWSQSTYYASEAVPIEPGCHYGARVRIDDHANDLSYSRTFSYIEPHVLPVGLRFVGWDGTQEADLVVMPDADLQQLVDLGRSLKSYDVIAQDVDIDALFSQHAASAADYPVSIILLPDTGVANNWGSESKPIIVTFGLAVQTSLLASPAAKSAFQHHIAQYDQSFVGTVYAGPDGDAPNEGVIIFVHDDMDVMLKAAVEEQAARDD